MVMSPCLLSVHMAAFVMSGNVKTSTTLGCSASIEMVSLTLNMFYMVMSPCLLSVHMAALVMSGNVKTSTTLGCSASMYIWYMVTSPCLSWGKHFAEVLYLDKDDTLSLHFEFHVKDLLN